MFMTKYLFALGSQEINDGQVNESPYMMKNKFCLARSSKQSIFHIKLYAEFLNSLNQV